MDIFSVLSHYSDFNLGKGDSDVHPGVALHRFCIISSMRRVYTMLDLYAFLIQAVMSGLNYETSENWWLPPYKRICSVWKYKCL